MGITLPCSPADCLCARFLGARGWSSGQGGRRQGHQPPIKGAGLEPHPRAGPHVGLRQGRPYLWQAEHSTQSQRSRARHPGAQRAGGTEDTNGPILRSPGLAWGQKTEVRASTCSRTPGPHAAGRLPLLGALTQHTGNPETGQPLPPTEAERTRPPRPPSFPASGWGLLVRCEDMCSLGL